MERCPTCHRPLAEEGTSGVAIYVAEDLPDVVTVAFQAAIGSFTVTPEQARLLAADLLERAQEIENRRS